jgi:hypothetical protein
LSPDAQVYVRNGREWIGKLLRYESGAEVPEREFNQAWQTYFPAYGDSPQVIASKRAARARAQSGVPTLSQKPGKPGGLLTPSPPPVDTSLPKMKVSTPDVDIPIEGMTNDQLLEMLDK